MVQKERIRRKNLKASQKYREKKKGSVSIPMNGSTAARLYSSHGADAAGDLADRHGDELEEIRREFKGEA